MATRDDSITPQPIEVVIPSASEAATSGVASSIRTILFHVHDDDSLMGRLELVLTLARACGAHVHCLHVMPIEAYTVVDALGTFVHKDIVRALEEEADNLRARLESKLSAEDVLWDYEEITGELAAHIVQRAALSDLVITGREPHRRDLGGPAVTLIGDLLAQIRTPLMITGARLSEWDACGLAVIAWNGSYEAANAVRGAIPLLKMAGHVRVVEFREDKPGRFPSTTLLEYLSRHGISAQLDIRPVPERVDEALVRYAQSVDAGFIVMGGYSHSRAGEFLFGGVTRALLKDCPVAIVTAH